jgi:hypothetical protein
MSTLLPSRMRHERCEVCGIDYDVYMQLDLHYETFFTYRKQELEKKVRQLQNKLLGLLTNKCK